MSTTKTMSRELSRDVRSFTIQKLNVDLQESLEKMEVQRQIILKLVADNQIQKCENDANRSQLQIQLYECENNVMSFYIQTAIVICLSIFFFEFLQ
jgi:hypothetical protein